MYSVTCGRTFGHASKLLQTRALFKQGASFDRRLLLEQLLPAPVAVSVLCCVSSCCQHLSQLYRCCAVLRAGPDCPPVASDLMQLFHRLSLSPEGASGASPRWHPRVSLAGNHRSCERPSAARQHLNVHGGVWVPCNGLACPLLYCPVVLLAVVLVVPSVEPAAVHALGGRRMQLTRCAVWLLHRMSLLQRHLQERSSCIAGHT